MGELEDELREKAYGPALHEAAHYVVARVLGFQAGEIYVDVTFMGAHGGSTIYLHTPLLTLEDLEGYLEQRIQVLSAGALAEALNDEGLNEEMALDQLRDGPSSNDWAKARENARTLCSIRFPEENDPNRQLEEIAVKLLNKAAEIVLAHRERIVAVANALIAKIDHPGRFVLAPSEVDAIIASHAAPAQPV